MECIYLEIAVEAMIVITISKVLAMAAFTLIAIVKPETKAFLTYSM